MNNLTTCNGADIFNIEKMIKKGITNFVITQKPSIAQMSHLMNMLRNSRKYPSLTITNKY